MHYIAVETRSTKANLSLSRIPITEICFEIYHHPPKAIPMVGLGREGHHKNVCNEASFIFADKSSIPATLALDIETFYLGPINASSPPFLAQY